MRQRLPECWGSSPPISRMSESAYSGSFLLMRSILYSRMKITTKAIVLSAAMVSNMGLVPTN